MAPLMLRFDDPTRKSSSRYLDRIPLEIYEEIFQYFQIDGNLNSRAHCKYLWGNLSLVCQYFRAYFVPLLFSHVKFETDSHWKDHTSKSCIAFSAAIAGGNQDSLEYARCVRSCNLVTRLRYFKFTRHHGVDQASSDRHPVESPYPINWTTALSHMTNISSLVLQNAFIDAAMLESICSLSNLTSLCFLRSWKLEDDLSPQSFRPLTELKLTSFHLSPPTDSGIPVSASFEEVLETCISTWPLRSLYMGYYQLSHRFISNCHSNQGLEALEELHVAGLKPTDSTAFSVFLERASSLLRLSISDSAMGYSECSSAAVPRLRSMKTPASWINGLITGRPIESIHFLPSLSDQLIDHGGLCTILRKSTSRIRDLYIEQELYEQLPPFSDFPECWLQNLTIMPTKILPRHKVTGTKLKRKIPDLEIYLSDLAGRLANPSNVQRLQIPFFNDFDLDLKNQHKVISSYITKAFPGVKAVVISGWIEWRIDLCGNWHPFLRGKESSRDGMRTLESFLARVKAYKCDDFAERFYYISDYDGFLSRVVPPTHPDWAVLKGISRNDEESDDLEADGSQGEESTSGESE